MLTERMRKLLAGGLMALSSFALPGVARAADHGDAPNIDHDSGADIADVYTFLDPNDNTRLIIAATSQGFIVPSEAVNFGSFDPAVKYHFEIERTGDAKPDAFIDITFSERTAGGQPQTATVNIVGLGGNKKRGFTFTAPTTPATLSATPATRAITTDPATNVIFFGGIVDDPFVFDIVGTNRFIASVNSGSPDPTQLSRGRNSFAGYNIMGIALSLPVSMVKGPGNVIGIAYETQRKTQSAGKAGNLKLSGKFKQLDRMGVPAVNVVLIPFARKSAYNYATPEQIAAGAFVPDILSVLSPFGTDQAHIGILANAAVTQGDYLHVDVSIANTGTGGGTNAEAAFPNGRRLGDDVVDTLLTIIANGTTLGDSTSAADVPFADTFPFFGLPQQPRDNGVIDDNTRN